MVKNANRKHWIRRAAQESESNYTSALRHIDGIRSLPSWVKPPRRDDIPGYLGYAEKSSDRYHLLDFAGEWKSGEVEEPHVAVLWVGRQPLGDDWHTKVMLEEGKLTREESDSWFLAEMERGEIAPDCLRMKEANHLGPRQSLDLEWQSYDQNSAWLDRINDEALDAIREPLLRGGDANGAEATFFDVMDPLWPRPGLYEGGHHSDEAFSPPLEGLDLSTALNIEKFPQMQLAASSSERGQILYLFRPSWAQPLDGRCQGAAWLFLKDQETGEVYSTLWWVQVSANGIYWGQAPGSGVNVS